MFKKSLMFFAMMTLVFSVFGCSSDAEQDASVGKTKLKVIVGNDDEILTVHWQITGTSAAGNAVDMEGDIDVSDPSSTISAYISGVPAGTGYTLTLDATTTNGASCTATNLFDVTAGETTYIDITLQCTMGSNNGDVVINGDSNMCPVIDKLSAMPLTQVSGKDVDVEAMASDEDGGTITYAWSAVDADGSDATASFEDADAADTVFHCDTAGEFKLTITVLDGDADAESTCAKSKSVDVVCLTAGVCGNGTLEPGEQCDDNNTDPCDGCDSGCRIEACGNGRLDCPDDQSSTFWEECDGEDNCNDQCRIIGCGNGIVEPEYGEECDPGDRIACDFDNNNCSAECKLEVCGNGVVECDEECDEESDTCQDCIVVVPPCTTCQADNCSDYLGAAPYPDCYDADANGTLCADMITCALENNCMYVTPNGSTLPMADPSACYCGDADQAACMGGSANGACKAEWEAGADSTDPMTIGARVFNTAYAAGDATNLLYCVDERCKNVCVL